MTFARMPLCNPGRDGSYETSHLRQQVLSVLLSVRRRSCGQQCDELSKKRSEGLFWCSLALGKSGYRCLWAISQSPGFKCADRTSRVNSDQAYRLLCHAQLVAGRVSIAFIVVICLVPETL